MESPVAFNLTKTVETRHGFRCQQADWEGKSSAVTKVLQQRIVSVRVGVSSAPQQGTGSIVWLLPSLRSF